MLHCIWRRLDTEFYSNRSQFSLQPFIKNEIGPMSIILEIKSHNHPKRLRWGEQRRRPKEGNRTQLSKTLPRRQ